MFKNPLTFKGKISGMELFLSWVICVILGSLSIYIVFKERFTDGKNMTLIISNCIFYYFLCYILLGQTIKGCRSIDGNIFSFATGRIRRTEYGLSWILVEVFHIVLFIPLVFIAEIFEEEFGETFIGFFGIILLILVVLRFAFLLIQSVKRCHDFNESGWLCIIPIYNPFWLLFAEGTRGKNRFGEDPKQIIEKRETI